MPSTAHPFLPPLFYQLLFHPPPISLGTCLLPTVTKSPFALINMQQLTIKYIDTHTVPERIDNFLKEKKAIELFISKHYDPDDRVLNLSNLAAHLTDFNVDFSNNRFVLQLFGAISQQCPDVLTVMFNRNKISKLSSFSRLEEFKMKIANISLESNEITNFEELSALKGLGLRLLVLSNNPLCARLDEMNYKLEVVRKLPDLEYLDFGKLRSKVDTPPATLPHFQGNYFDSPIREEVAFSFLKRYYEAFDNDRNVLIEAYADHACFSLSVAPCESKQGRFPVDKFLSYSPMSRNLQTITAPERRSSALKTGPTHIVGSLLNLPPSKHDPSSFTLDCFVSRLGGLEVLNIFVTGSYQESIKTRRSFSRTFLLMAAPVGSKAQTNGWPGVIINDQLYVRFYTPKRETPQPKQVHPLQNQNPQPQNPQPPQSSLPQSIPQQEPLQLQLDVDTKRKQSMVLQFAGVTKLAVHFSEECLANNLWDYDRAVADFLKLKERNIIPAEYFTQ